MRWRTNVLALSLVGVGVLMGLLIAAAGPVSNTAVAPNVALADTQPARPEAPPTPQQRAGLTTADALSEAFSWVAARVTPSVVTIKSEQTVRPSAQDLPDLPPELLPMLPRQREFRREALGSGVIVSPDGYILTNNHVVEGADKLTVLVSDQMGEVPARIVGRDPWTDLAVIKVDQGNLPAIQFGNSDSLKVGYFVLAIGSPFGEELQHTVTNGIVSALGRTIGIIEPNPNYAGFEDFIQTDAAINPGNSGGALVDMHGKLVGINTAISSPSGTNSGIGFAIPVSMARQVMTQLIEHGQVRRGYLGVAIGRIDDEEREVLGLPDLHGALVADVTRNSPAAQAGLKVGDVIRSINGQAVTGVDDLRYRIASTAPGQTVTLGIWRERHEMSVRAQLAELPAQFRQPAGEEQAPETARSTSSRLGIGVRTLTPDQARQRGVERGVIVTRVEGGSQADERGLQQGDIIEEVNLQPVGTAEEFERRTSQIQPGQAVLLLVRRGEGTLFIGLRIPTKSGQ